MKNNIEQFLTSKAYAVAGASTNRSKYGNKVLRCYLQHNMTVYPINPRATLIEGVVCIPCIADLPDDVKSLSIITPPAITEKIVEEAIQKGIKNIWMQPGAESDKAIQDCLDNQINVIAEGPCILVVLGFREF
ncbi:MULTISPECIES: CoA-binding protein [Legionella]|uniref:CoA-binding protein n=1 Tax=Legionella septentrionalis TaxID=2498109 RepID=A0A433JJL8_9GAMM|nr:MULTISPECIES: CoA-binding protein [Legionella]MCP0912853.1 CoA-binding protein [Legionella sp. 27cVA30]RUQ88374.1 CoA-binding protein [Legionella septentrionalis]RUQ93514.1 CoA-binding protein [Legionella septentrionalis]RUR09480.1 CoA-binding protein [Legionella septentrionalis]RUR13253.1 CoA-binding protein [Legionella septentrionalis]